MSQLKKGAMLSYANIFLLNIGGLILTPFIIKSLGTSEYGLYTLVGSLVAYISVFDFGLNNTIVRFVAKYKASKQRIEEENFLATSMIIYAFLSFLILITGLIFYTNIESLFTKLTDSELIKAKKLFAILIFNLTITIPGGAFAAICSAYEKFVFPRVLNLIKYIVRALLIVTLLLFEGDSISLVVLDTVLNIIVISVNAYFVFQILKVKFKLHHFEINAVKQIFSYSVWIFVYALASQFQWQSGQVVLGVVSGTKAVAIYGVGVLLGSYYSAFSSAISGLFIPKAVQMVVNDNSTSQLTDTMILVGRLCQFVLFFILGGFLLFGKQFINLWVGTTYQDAWQIALIIMIGYTTPLIQIFGNSILEAKGKYSFKAILNLICLFLGVLLGFFLTTYYQSVGMIIGLCSFWILSQIIMNFYFVKVIHLEMKRFFIEMFSKTILTFPIIIFLGYLTNLFFGSTWFFLIIKIVLYSLIYSLITYFYSFNNYEKNLISGVLNKFKK